MSPVHGVLLDVDGTLVDSNDAHAHAWVKAFSEHGFEVKFERVRRLIGKGGDKVIKEMAGWDDDSEQAKQLSERRREIFLMQFLPTLRPFPMVRELLQHMKANGLRLVVASSAKADELERLLRLCGADQLVEAKTSSDDAERSKPDPDIVAAALKEIALPAAQVVMLGDTPYDIESASHVDVPVIGLRCGGWNDVELRGALAVYDDPADLLKHYDSSPLGQGAVRRGPGL